MLRIIGKKLVNWFTKMEAKSTHKLLIFLLLFVHLATEMLLLKEVSLSIKLYFIAMATLLRKTLLYLYELLKIGSMSMGALRSFQLRKNFGSK